ncbi:MAG: hypothetical protein AB1720_03975 [Pseudomonadota bacterium]|jgi:hypothetical protein
MAAFAIAGGGGEGLMRLFVTHPPLEERIAARRPDSMIFFTQRRSRK